MSSLSVLQKVQVSSMGRQVPSYLGSIQVLYRHARIRVYVTGNLVPTGLIEQVFSTLPTSKLIYIFLNHLFLASITQHS